MKQQYSHFSLLKKASVRTAAIALMACMLIVVSVSVSQAGASPYERSGMAQGWHGGHGGGHSGGHGGHRGW